jgi:hypothetical protein
MIDKHSIGTTSGLSRSEEDALLQKKSGLFLQRWPAQSAPEVTAISYRSFWVHSYSTPYIKVYLIFTLLLISHLRFVLK